MPLNLYLIDRQDNVGHDETDSVIVAAVTPKQAREIAATVEGDQPSSVWAHGQAKLQRVGTAVAKQKQGIVLRSYRAG